MADVLQKIVRSVIDKRTTVVCLHAAGQVRPVSVPFDTMNGEFMEPPFHVHCRSQSVPWMQGFEDDMRRLANAELARRPKGKPVRLPPRPHDPPTAGGLPAGGPPGKPPLPPGSAALDDVPPTLRKEWMEANPERFEITANGGGISETYWVKDVATGKRYVLKKGQYNAESVNEIAGTRFDDAIGLRGGARIAGDMADGNGYLLLDHAEDVYDGYRVVGTGGGHAQIAKMADRLEDQREAVRVLLTDFVRDEADAKGGNMLLLSKDGGKTVRLVPIDRSLGLMGWRNAIEPGKTSIVSGDWSLAGRLKVADLRQYMKTRGSPKGVMEMVQGLDSRLVRETYDEVLAAMKRVDLDDVFDGLDGAAAREARELMQHRITLLEQKRAVLLKQMGVSDEVQDAVSAVSRPAPTARVLAGVPERQVVQRTIDDLLADVDGLHDHVHEVSPTGLHSGQGAHAEYRRGQKQIVLYADHWDDAAIARGRGAGFYVDLQHLTAAEQTVTHEAMHAVDAMLAKMRDTAEGRAVADQFAHGLGRILRAGRDVDYAEAGTWKQLLGDSPMVRYEVSEYATKNLREFVAETLTQWRHADSPGPLTTWVGRQYEQMLNVRIRTKSARLSMKQAQDMLLED